MLKQENLELSKKMKDFRRQQNITNRGIYFILNMRRIRKTSKIKFRKRKYIIMKERHAQIMKDLIDHFVNLLNNKNHFSSFSWFCLSCFPVFPLESWNFTFSNTLKIIFGCFSLFLLLFLHRSNFSFFLIKCNVEGKKEIYSDELYNMAPRMATHLHSTPSYIEVHEI